MRAGRVIDTHDNEGNTCYPSFGNYVSIDHLDGQYSHYAHIAAGTLTVQPGQTIAAGTPLGTMGNSGFAYRNSPCDGGGYHVHVEVTKTPQLNGSHSMPFLFDEVPPGPGQAVRGRDIVSQNSQSVTTPTTSSEADIAWSGILARARSDARFVNEIAGSRNYDASWGGGSNSMRDLRYADFYFTGGRSVRIFHAFYNNVTSNLGATTFLDPDSGNWAPWINVQP